VRPVAGARLTWLALVAALLVVGLLWWQGGTGTPPESATTADSAGTPAASDPSGPTDGATGTDPGSGLPLVDLDALPPEARDAVERVDDGGPFPYDQDDGVFENRERLLPDHAPGYYREYTVETPGSADRGARRLVVGSGGEVYWTDDHYASFSRVAR
jgi:ribonuclease T1